MPGRPRCRSWYLIAMTLLVALQAPTPAWAWGRLDTALLPGSPRSTKPRRKTVESDDRYRRVCVGMSFALDEKKAVLATLFTQGRLTRPAGDRSRRYKLVLGPDDGARVVVRVAPARHRTCERRAVGGQLIGGRYAPLYLEDAAESRARSRT